MVCRLDRLEEENRMLKVVITNLEEQLKESRKSKENKENIIFSKSLTINLTLQAEINKLNNTIANYHSLIRRKDEEINRLTQDIESLIRTLTCVNDLIGEQTK